MPGSDQNAFIPCISVIDEASQQTMQFFEQKWIEFRSRYPNRPFCLLQPEPNPSTDLRMPFIFVNDPLTRFASVSRDRGDDTQASDWFDICGLTSATTDKVALFIDNSGSLTINQVRSSFLLLQFGLAAASMDFVLGDDNIEEDWISPFIRDFL